VVATLAQQIDPQRYRMHACFLDGVGPLIDELESDGIPVSVLNWVSGASDPRGAWQFYQRLHRTSFALVHQHFAGRAAAYLARWATGAKLIYHVWGRGCLTKSARRLPPPAEAILVPSHGTAALLPQLRPSLRPRVVYPGLNIEKYSAARRDPPTPSDLLIGTAARLVPIKGIVTAIRAVANLQHEFPSLHLEIAGDGPERENLENEVQQLHIANRVSFLGWVPNLAPLMARWQIFLLPSQEEPFGIVGLEAMASGLPVIASAIEGLPEVVCDGITGWLVPPADPEKLAERLRLLLLDPQMRRAMGTAAESRAREHFSAHGMAARITEIYDEVLDGFRPM
jgi:glycosyltransferase involved in cell wall biosynthesis